MECCYTEDCGEYAVTPVLMAPCPRTKDEEPPMCFPCLPRCPKGEIVYCCEKRPGTQRTKSWTKNYDDHRDESYSGDYDHYETSPQRPRQRSSPSRPNRHERPSGPPQTCCPTCCRPTVCQPGCKPVKTKYVIPCYRYEDGRIDNQPTLLMRRACEVAVGARPRRKPFVESSYCEDEVHTVQRFHSEDERVSYKITEAEI